MKVIKSYPTNSVTSADASPVDSGWPASNLIDEHPKQACKSTGAELTLSFAVSSGADGIAIFNITANTATVTISGSSAIPLAVKVGTGAVTLKVGTGAVTLLSSVESSNVEIFDATKGRLWIEYTAITQEHRIDVILSATAGEIAKAGVGAAATILDYKEPRINITESAKNYSIERLLHGGELHITDKDSVRTFDFSFWAKRDDATVNDAWHFMNTLYHGVKSHPIAWRLNSTEDNEEWLVFAKFDGSPKISHGSTWSLITMRLLEVL